MAKGSCWSACTPQEKDEQVIRGDDKEPCLELLPKAWAEHDQESSWSAVIPHTLVVSRGRKTSVTCPVGCWWDFLPASSPYNHKEIPRHWSHGSSQIYCPSDLLPHGIMSTGKDLAGPGALHRRNPQSLKRKLLSPNPGASFIVS